MLALAVLGMTMAAAGEVTLALEPATPCLERARLKTALEARGVSVRERPGAHTLTLRLGPGAGGGVELHGTHRERRLERSIPAEPSACAAVERVVVALIESWATARPVKPPPSPARATAAGTDSPNRPAVAAPDSTRRPGTAGTDAADVTAVAATESANRPGAIVAERPGVAAPEPASRSGTATDAADVTAVAATESANRRALTATDSDKRPGASAP
ncbi:MAG: hypothetical protein AB1730_14275, partial [Myxococcota bacterium]